MTKLGQIHWLSLYEKIHLHYTISTYINNFTYATPLHNIFVDTPFTLRVQNLLNFSIGYSKSHLSTEKQDKK